MVLAMVRWITLLIGIGAAALAAAAPADAAVRHASPTADAGETTCTALAPCPIHTAVNSATAADEVVVSPGTYTVTTALELTKAIHVHGEAGAARPILSGDASLPAATLTVAIAGATVSHLDVRAASAQQNAITVEAGATIDRVVAISQTASGIEAVTDTTPTVIRNAVAVSHGTSTSQGYAGLRVVDGPNVGTAEVRNVTAWADATSSVGFGCRTTKATTTIVNTVARGTTYDVDAGVLTGKMPKCPATTSNARTANSPGFTAASQAEPVWVNAAADDYRPQAASPTIDAGTNAAANGTLELGGASRTQGATTDVGAYEFAPPVPPQDAPVEEPQSQDPPSPDPPSDGQTPDDPTPNTPLTPATPTRPNGTATNELRATTGPAPTPTSTPSASATTPTQALPPAAPPQLGQSMLLDTGKGEVRVKLPGAKTYVPLGDAANLPLGTTIDATRGEVTLSTALPGGEQQTGSFSGGRFQVRQSRSARARGMTDIHLTGGDFTRCSTKRRARKASATATAAARRGKPSKRVRRLWGKDKSGRFRTHGRDSVATVRGTRWLTEDRCDGTFTQVTEGAVDVRDKRTGKVRRVKAGRSLLVRAAKRR